MKLFIFLPFVIIFQSTLSTSIIISKGPQNATVCVNAVAECDCGFTGASPYTTVPSWRIILRNDDGSVVNDVTHHGFDITNGHINDLQWLADLTSGNNNASNSKLLVGPVNKIHNQSSYQCIFTILSGSISSSVGIMTVVGPPSVIIDVDEICTTSITISLDTYSHPACGDVSHNVTISGNVIYPDTINGSKYTIDDLHTGTLYNITVTSTYNSGSRMFAQSVNTSLSKSPNPIDSNSIEIMMTNDTEVTVMWKPAKIDDECSMVAVEYYDVRISYSDGEIILERTVQDNATTFMFDYKDDDLIITFSINITVVDINGQKSESSVVERNITSMHIPNNLSSNTTEGESDERSDNSATIIIGIIVAAAVIGIIIIIIIIISTSYYLKYLEVHKSHHTGRISINVDTKIEDNSNVEAQDGIKIHDMASPYAVSGPTSVWCDDSTQSNTHQDETVHEQSTVDDHADESVHSDDSTPPLPPRLNYAELQLTNHGPKRMHMKADTHVTYVETKSA